MEKKGIRFVLVTAGIALARLPRTNLKLLVGLNGLGDGGVDGPCLHRLRVLLASCKSLDIEGLV